MGGRLGLIQNCVTVHLSKQRLREAGRESERGGGEIGRETDNQLVREGWRSDSQCTITLVFRFGPSERSFWTHLCLDVSSSFFFFFSSLFLAWSSLQWKHIPVMPHCCSLFRFLITKQHYTHGLELAGAQARQRPGTSVLHGLQMKEPGLSHGDRKPRITDINFLHALVLGIRETSCNIRPSQEENVVFCFFFAN